MDYKLDENQQPEDQAYVFKIWNSEMLIADGYKHDENSGIYGGHCWGQEYKQAYDSN